MRTSSFSVLLPLLLAATLSAQSVSPAHFTSVEAPTSNIFPFGSVSVPFRYLQVHDDVTSPVVFGMRFRHTCSSSGGQESPFAVTIDAWVSTAASSAAGITTTFDNNHGPDKIQCVTNRTIQVPANDPTRIPQDFLVDVPFDPGVVFVFAGAPASLCWEVHVTARTNISSVFMDYVSASAATAANPTLQATRGGSGCVATGQTDPMLAAPTSTAMSWPTGTGDLVVNGSRLLPNGVIVWVNGLDRTQWNGIPLPLTVPTSTGAPSGTCTLYTDPFFLTAATASATGTAQLSLPLTVTPALHGFVVYTQILGLDAAANAFGFTTSNLAAQQLVAPYASPNPARRVYRAGTLAPTGTSDGGQLITQFY